MANREAINVKRFVENVSKEAAQNGVEGGVSPTGTDISPLIMIKAGEKITVDFSQESIDINDYGDTGAGVTMSEYSNIWLRQGEYKTLMLSITKNEANTQLVAHIEDDQYQVLSNEVVIYEGDVSEIYNTESILAQLPTVEFTVPNSYEDIIFIIPSVNWITQ